LGTSGGAALGLLVGQWIGGVFFYYGMIFLGALCATLSSYLLARTERSVSIVNLLLSGMMVSAFCGALIFLFFTLQSHSTFSTIFFLMGSLMEGDWLLISISSTIIFLGMAMAFCLAPKLNIFSLGEEKVQTLGISVELFKFTVFILASLMVSAAVALAGPIGFVGLMVPHITRLIIGPNHRVLIPGAALIGGILLLMADALARTIAAPLEIPVGVITAMMGAPFFLWLLRKKRKEKYF
jgi:iron complex transport system permease protein